MPKSIRRHSKKRGTRRNKGDKGNRSMQNFEREVVVKFIQTLNLVKLYHWKTHSYATHKATDELYTKLNDNMDTFVEVLLGKQGDRVNLTMVKTISLKAVTSLGEFKREIDKFKAYLVDLNNCPALKSMSNSDLYNIRDEILGNINQLLYLLTFK